MQRYEQMLLENKAWAQETKEVDPKYFERLSATQKPEFLWIGCSDSRVSPNDITETKPGEIFIHRNIANLVVHTDSNLLSVLQYAVEVLQIRHVIVCGHYGCGGVQAALSRNSYGKIDEWLRHIKDVYRLNKPEIDGITDQTQKVDRLIELNVREQLLNLAKTSFIQKAWATKKQPYLHGWVYDMRNGIIHPQLELGPDTHGLDPIYEYENFLE